MKKALIYSFLLITVVVLCMAVFLSFFVPQFSPLDHGNQQQFNDVSAVADFIESLGVKVQIPCVEDSVEIIPDKNWKLYILPIYKGNENAEVARGRKGEPITLNFQSFSDKRHGGWRKTEITVGTRTYEGYIETSALARMYLNYIESSGLQDEFEKLTGNVLNKKSAKQVIRSIDKQIFDYGIWNPADYPLNEQLIWRAITIGSICLILGIMVLSVILETRKEKRIYEEYLQIWNEESMERWLELYGNLTQFRSLKESGIRDEYRYIIYKRSLRQIIVDMFRPVKYK
ncbi:MAG: hypothetical protein E7430_01120 [Ruminococcaceae bacterium]|nr:hypothetical protein [Oscillospiraceae bacterium]